MTTTTTQPPVHCPSWCVSHESPGRDGTVTVHRGRREAPTGFIVSVYDGEPEPCVMYLTRSTTADGEVFDDGMMLGSTFLPSIQAETLLRGLLDRCGAQRGGPSRAS
jgi:hypothetical protein